MQDPKITLVKYYLDRVAAALAATTPAITMHEAVCKDMLSAADKLRDAVVDLAGSAHAKLAQRFLEHGRRVAAPSEVYNPAASTAPSTVPVSAGEGKKTTRDKPTLAAAASLAAAAASLAAARNDPVSLMKAQVIAEQDDLEEKANTDDDRLWKLRIERAAAARKQEKEDEERFQREYQKKVAEDLARMAACGATVPTPKPATVVGEVFGSAETKSASVHHDPDSDGAVNFARTTKLSRFSADERESIIELCFTAAHKLTAARNPQLDTGSEEFAKLVRDEADRRLARY